MSALDFNAIGNKFNENLTIAGMQGLADDIFRSSFEDLVQRLNADAGAVWIVDKDKPDELTIAINVGARGSEIEGQVSQELASGLVSKSFREEKLIHDEGRFRAPEQSDSVDMELQQMTNYQIALPFFMFGKKIGAVTAVQVSTLQKPNRADWGFKPECLDTFTNWIAIAQRLLEYAEVRSNG